MPLQSFWMRVIIFIFGKINWYPIHIQYGKFIHTCLFCFGEQQPQPYSCINNMTKWV